MPIMRMYNFSFFYLTLVFTLTLQANAQSYSNAEVTGLMKKAEYPEVARLAATRLEALPLSATNERLYYMTKLGLARFRMGNFDTAYRIGGQALELTKRTRDSVLISDTWLLMAYAYNRTGRFDSAILFSNKLLNYSIRNNDHVKHGNALTSLSTILMQNKRYREALKYNFEANALYRKYADTLFLAASEYNIGLTYLNLNKPDSSLAYLFRSLSTYRNYPKGDLNAYILEAIAECYHTKGNIPLWEEYLLKSNEAAAKTGNQQFVALGFSQLGQQALSNVNYTAAYNYLIKAREALHKQPYPALQMRVDSMLYLTARGQMRYAEALKWLESYTTLQRRIFTEQQSVSLNQIMVENETHKKNLLILQKELELSKVKRSLSNLIIAAVFILLFAGVLLVYLVRVSRYRNKLFLINKELDQQLQIARSRFEMKLTEPAKDGENTENDSDSLPEEDQNQRSIVLYSSLLNLIETEKLYLDTELNVKTLQNKLGTNKKYLYEAIAQFSGTNFRGLINRYRINEVRHIMEEALGKEETIPVNSIVTATGFNSYTSFYRIFRQYTGLTPNEYIAQLKKEKKRPHSRLS